MTNIEQEDLFKQYEFIVKDVYKKLNKNDFILSNKSDIEQEGYLALWRGLLNYKDIGSSIFSFLYSCVQNAILKYLKYNQPKDYLYSLDYDYDSENEYNLYETIIGEDPTDCLNFDLEFVLHCYKTWLLKKYKNRSYKNTLIAKRLAKATIIVNYLLDGKNYRDVQIDKNIGRTTCSNVMLEIREALKEIGNIHFDKHPHVDKW